MRWMTWLWIVFLVWTLGSISYGGPETPGAKQNGPIALIGGTVHTVGGNVLPDAMVVFREGRIDRVGVGLAVGDEVTRIEVTGQHVYPV